MIMKTLNKLPLILFTLLVMSFAAFAQSNDKDKKDPPKKEGDRPKIEVKDKDRDKDRGKDDKNDKDKPKKPQSEGALGAEIVKAIFG